MLTLYAKARVGTRTECGAVCGCELPYAVSIYYIKTLMLNNEAINCGQMS